MNWGSLDNFLHMGGYGLYVWGSYAVTALCIVAEIWLVANRKRTLRKQLTQMMKLKQTSQ